MYKADGTVVSKKFNKKIISDTEWQYEAWFPTENDYFIIENVPEGYQVTYRNVGVHADVVDRLYNGGTIINKKIPKTGDEANLVLWIASVLVGVTGLTALFIAAKHRKTKK